MQITGPSLMAIFSMPRARHSAANPLQMQLATSYFMGSTPDRIMDYTIISDTTNAPQQTISSLAQAQTWWTVRAYDQYGSTIYADPRLIRLPENGPPVADTGPHQVPPVTRGLTERPLLPSAARDQPTPTAMRLAIPGHGQSAPRLIYPMG